MLHLMTSTVTLKSKTMSTDSQGGWTYTWSAGTSSPARISRNAPPRDSFAGTKREARATYTVYLPATAAVDREYQVVASSPSLTLRVLSVLRPSQNASHLECLCEEVQAGI